MGMRRRVTPKAVLANEWDLASNGVSEQRRRSKNSSFIFIRNRRLGMGARSEKRVN